MDTHFSKFTDAITSLSKHHPNALPQFKQLQLVVRDALLIGQRFYVPEASHIIAEGSNISSNTLEMLHLPFDCVSILSETVIKDNDPTFQLNDGKDAPSWKITLAFETNSLINSKTGFIDPSITNDYSFCIISMFISPKSKEWVLFPRVILLSIDDGHGEYLFRELDLRMDFSSFEPLHLKLEDFFHDDALSVLNLCVMLNLENVKSSRIDPPAALNKKRIRNAKSELLSYHVLKVNGEEWNSRGGAGGGHGVRSHLRRGHIRRIDGGERCIWVRSAYVHGSITGFVSKDYHVTKPRTKS